MEENYKNILSETSFIIQHFEKEIYDKIPNDILDYIEKNKNENYIVNYESNKKLKNQKFNNETFEIVSMLFLKYCVEEDERRKLLDICRENEIKKEKILNEKFNSDNIFKKNREIEVKTKLEGINNNKNAIAPKKEGIISKIKKIIKGLFKRG